MSIILQCDKGLAMAKTLKKRMIESIVKAKDLTLGANPFYWYSQLDYSKDTSHPKYQVLEKKVEADLKIIEEAKYLMQQYEKIGVTDIREYFTESWRNK